MGPGFCRRTGVQRDLSRRDYRTQPGVLTPGTDLRNGLALKRRRRIWFRSSKGYINSEFGDAFLPALQGGPVFADEPGLKTPG
jgi:hypothetical protein